ncbi:1-(5-phosphoribosyl)-5-[(5-phosphoribosylamino)methylideneamino]imidazole-4-carboxamide isomerase [Candidatus Saganbacteria bacterium]|nr:1-(5-phosphoribosyl)-5-[(5-phosphoribosylamino)methylideneamino]imidazole-4-carboxamide isomerase [Candidatus Saganbacteria bacterium]
MFEIIPAVDILNGKCVRLKQGSFDKETVFFQNPLDAAKHFVEKGAKRLHIVDLDGARTGTPKNFEIIKTISENITIPIQVGGGYRKMEDIEALVSLGISRVVLGTSAIFNPNLIMNVCERYDDQIVVAVDAKDGKVMANGWTNVSQKSATSLAQEAVRIGVKRFIFTDISRDGMMAGPNFDAIQKFASSVDVPVIASGGITKKEDVDKLRALKVEGCVIGQALYIGAIKLEDIL